MTEEGLPSERFWLETHDPPLTVRVYAQWEIERIDPPAGRFAVVSITDTDRRASLANLTNLGPAPVLRLSFHDGATARGMTDEQAVRFWEFIRASLGTVDTVLLHCGAGAVRSPALALALSRAFRGDEIPADADAEPDAATYATAARTFSRVFDRPFPAPAGLRERQARDVGR